MSRGLGDVYKRQTLHSYTLTLSSGLDTHTHSVWGYTPTLFSGLDTHILYLGAAHAHTFTHTFTHTHTHYLGLHTHLTFSSELDTHTSPIWGYTSHTLFRDRHPHPHTHSVWGYTYRDYLQG